jgi:hypothetical protein
VHPVLEGNIATHRLPMIERAPLYFLLQ